MNEYLKVYQFELKTLTPLFIGSGGTIGKKDYLYDRNRNQILLVDMRRMFDGLQKLRLLEAYERYVLQPCKDLYAFLKENNIDRKESNQWIRAVEDVADHDLIDRNTKPILTFMKDSYGNPYIPGSSIKGLMRTILASSAIMERENVRSELAVKVKNAQVVSRRKYLQDEDRLADYRIFHKNLHEDKALENEVNDTMAGFIIGDSQPLKPSDLCICQKVDMTVEGEARRLPILRECLKPGISVRFQITIDTKVCPFTIEILKKAIGQFADNYESEFLNGFKNYPVVLAKEPIVYMGGGTGYPTKTVTYSVFSGREGVNQVSKILDATINPKDRRKHDHVHDINKGVSPHMLKCTIYHDKVMQMGACEVKQI